MSRLDILSDDFTGSLGGCKAQVLQINDIISGGQILIFVTGTYLYLIPESPSMNRNWISPLIIQINTVEWH